MKKEKHHRGPLSLPWPRVLIPNRFSKKIEEKKKERKKKKREKKELEKTTIQTSTGLFRVWGLGLVG